MLTVYVEDENGRRIGVIACGDAVFSTGNLGFRGNGKVVVNGVKYQASIVVSKVVTGLANEAAERSEMAERAKIIAEAKAEKEKAEAQKAKTTEAQKAALASARKGK
jgi:hypothetical protein